ncbi:MAG: tetratricopeptide repeat protein [Fibromonadaceae bacterium]|jgi:tetratricopeptide (TPR) repeat protein|nr:tetratricopeptide repeat protein [Fibromonadaceae bacterium]
MKYTTFFAASALSLFICLSTMGCGTQHFVLYKVGEAYASPPDYDKAIEYYKKAIKSKPDYAEAHYGIGQAYLSKGDCDSAIKYFNIADTLKPDSAHAKYSGFVYAGLGFAYSYQKNDSMALEYYKKAVAQYNDPKAYLGLGLVYLNKKDYKNMIDNIGKAIELDSSLVENLKKNLEMRSDLVDVYIGIADAYKGKGDYDNVIEYYQKVFKLANDAKSLYAIAAAYKAKGDAAKEQEYENKAKELSNKHGE